MSMVAIFACTNCRAESVHGRFRGEPMYIPEFRCLRCGEKKVHSFVRYQGEEFVSAEVRKLSARQA